MNKFFNVIIPCFNNESTLFRAVKSVEKQTFKQYRLIIVDDCSTDGTLDTVRGIRKADIMPLHEKRYNGGARNVGLMEAGYAEYTLFLDADDEFVDPEFFKKLHDFILVNGSPDIVRLPYTKYFDLGRIEMIKKKGYPNERSIEDTAKSTKVAPWTKCVKTDLLSQALFPENTLMEDVVQHLKLCDIAQTVAWFPDVAVKWHINEKSTSHNMSPKWQSSAWRFVADLMDLELTKPYTKARRDEKIRLAKENLKNGKAEQ